MSLNEDRTEQDFQSLLRVLEYLHSMMWRDQAHLMADCSPENDELYKPDSRANYGNAAARLIDILSTPGGRQKLTTSMNDRELTLALLRWLLIRLALSTADLDRPAIRAWTLRQVEHEDSRIASYAGHVAMRLKLSGRCDRIVELARDREFDPLGSLAEAACRLNPDSNSVSLLEQRLAAAGDDEIRLLTRAVEALADSDDPNLTPRIARLSVQALVRCRDYSWDLMRIEVMLRSIRRLPRDDASAALARIVDSDAHPNYRGPALLALADVESRAAVSRCEAALGDAEMERFAISALGAAAKGSNDRQLLQRLIVRDVANRLALMDAIAQIGGKGVADAYGGVIRPGYEWVSSLRTPPTPSVRMATVASGDLPPLKVAQPTDRLRPLLEQPHQLQPRDVELLREFAELSRRLLGQALRSPERWRCLAAAHLLDILGDERGARTLKAMLADETLATELLRRAAHWREFPSYFRTLDFTEWAERQLESENPDVVGAALYFSQTAGSRRIGERAMSLAASQTSDPNGRLGYSICRARQDQASLDLLRIRLETATDADRQSLIHGLLHLACAADPVVCEGAAELARRHAPDGGSGGLFDSAANREMGEILILPDTARAAAFCRLVDAPGRTDLRAVALVKLADYDRAAALRRAEALLTHPLLKVYAIRAIGIAGAGSNDARLRALLQPFLAGPLRFDASRAVERIGGAMPGETVTRAGYQTDDPWNEPREKWERDGITIQRAAEILVEYGIVDRGAAERALETMRAAGYDAQKCGAQMLLTFLHEAGLLVAFHYEPHRDGTWTQSLLQQFRAASGGAFLPRDVCELITDADSNHERPRMIAQFTADGRVYQMEDNIDYYDASGLVEAINTALRHAGCERRFVQLDCEMWVYCFCAPTAMYAAASILHVPIGVSASVAREFGLPAGRLRFGEV
ncbi:MAG: hypothetical protein U1D55_05030 [Phycisphaerae bacterium]